MAVGEACALVLEHADAEGDLRATVLANGVAIFAPQRAYDAGSPITTLLWPEGD